MWSVRFLAVPALLAVAASAPAAVPDYPFKPIRYVTGSSPGGAGDIVARTISPALTEQLGVQIVIDNRPGVGNTIGAEIAAKAMPDGYTIFGCNIASLAVSPALYRKLNYDAERDFAPLGLVAGNPNVLTIHPSLPASNITQFVALAKANPGKLNYASAGIGTSPQLSMELLRMQARINIVHVPYKGIGTSLVDVMGGRVEALISTVPSALSAIRRAKVRPLGVTSKERDLDLPEVPTFVESGMPGFEVTSWQGLCTQAAVPQPMQARLRNALATALNAPDVAKRLADQGFQPNPLSADKFGAFIRAEQAKWAKLVKEAGIPPQ